LAAAFLLASAGRLTSLSPETPASFSLICRPVVPASPSMKIVDDMDTLAKS
jgi:hypothetical protein